MKSTAAFLILLICCFTTAQRHHRLVLSEHKATDEVRIRTLPADPQTYIDSGSVPSSVIFQQPSGKWTSITTDYNRDSIIWSDAESKLLWKGNVTQLQATPIYRGVSDAVGGVSVDWMTGNVYWSDQNYNWILLLDRNRNTKVLIDTGLEIPGGVAVHPERGFLFWTNRGTKPKIERSNLAGKNRQLVATAGVTAPRGITVDYVTERVYWTDSNGAVTTLESCDLRGSDRKTEFRIPASEGILDTVAIYQNYIYITDMGNALRCLLKDRRIQYFNLDIGARGYGITLLAPQTIASHFENPCRSNLCDHICISDGYNGYKCMCRDGYTLLQDETTCLQDDFIAPPIIIVAFRTKICWYPGNFPDMPQQNTYTDNCLLQGQKFTAAVAVDEDDQLLFFSDIKAKSIRRVRLQNNASVEEVIGQRGSVEGLAVDWLSQNIYWTDDLKNHIAVSRYDGSYFKILVEKDVQNPKSIAVDPHERLIFWTQFGPPAQVTRANLDGNSEVVIVADTIMHPRGLAVDYDRKCLYFADTAYGAIQAVDYNGDNRKVIIVRRKQFFDITIFKDYLLWTEWESSNGVHILNKETTDYYGSHLMLNEESVYGITSFSKYRQRRGNGPCGTRNGGCQQLCLPSGPLGSYTCSCSAGYHLHEDGRSCVSAPVNDNFIVLTDTYLNGIYQLDMTKQPPALSALSSLGYSAAPLGIGYDPVEEMIYWSDTNDNTITRASMNGDQKEVIIGGQGEANIYKPQSMAIESWARLVFWTDINQRSIIVSRLDGTRKKTLVRDIEYPRDIVVHARRGAGYIFWTSWGESAKIERSFTDGGRRLLIANESLGWPHSLTIDIKENHLYWTDAKFHRIEVSDFLGLTRRILTTLGEKSHPFGIVLYNNSLYWSDWASSGLSRFEIQPKYNSEHATGVFDVEPAIFGRPNYMYAFTKAAETIGNNACIVSNGGCSGLCLPIGFSRTCACEDGMQLKSDWTTCEKDTSDIQCPKNFTNGEVTEGCSLISGSRCSYQCHDGYRALFSDVLCLSTGSWRREQHPLCQEIFCPEPDINYVTVKKSCSLPYAVGTICVFECKSGYQKTEGYETTSCNISGQWTGHLLECGSIPAGNGATENGDTDPQLPGIALITTPDNITIELGALNLMQRCATNDSLAEITWYKDGQELPSDAIEGVFRMAGGQLFIPEVVKHHAGKYTCRAQSQETLEIVEAVAHFSFLPETIFQITPNDATIEAGDDYIFECTTNDPTYIVEWEKDGGKLVYKEVVHKIPMTDNLLIRKAIGADSGRYTCVVLTFDRTKIAETSAELVVIPLQNTDSICGTITEQRAVTHRDLDDEERQEGRIVNGTTSISGAAPWMARLYSRSRRTHFCGGNLINRQWILTAGHCIREWELKLQGPIQEDLLIRLGDYDDMTHENSEELISVTKIKLHHKFDFGNFDRDIALVKLSRPVDEFSDFIRPICLSNATYGNQLTMPGIKGLVVGWGKVAEDGHYARYMKEVTLPIRGRKTCTDSTKYLFSKYMFCAGNIKTNGDACEGDSGGPFAIMEAGRWHLVGIVSWGEGCAREGKYGYYTKVPKFYNWIQAQINRHS